MALAIRRRWIWLLGGLAVFTVLVYGAARFADEPLRRYMEAEVNRRLTGYTVQIAVLHLHPWTASVELRDATLAQDANPNPPIAQVGRLVTRVDWRALLHRRVVADISFDQPRVYLNLKQVRTEASETTALKDRGWQRALACLSFLLSELVHAIIITAALGQALRRILLDEVIGLLPDAMISVRAALGIPHARPQATSLDGSRRGMVERIPEGLRRCIPLGSLLRDLLLQSLLVVLQGLQPLLRGGAWCVRSRSGEIGRVGLHAGLPGIHLPCGVGVLTGDVHLEDDGVGLALVVGVLPFGLRRRRQGQAAYQYRRGEYHRVGFHGCGPPSP